MSQVLVTGAAGYIGSHAVRALLRAGHKVVALDDLSHGHRAAVAPECEFIAANTGDTEMLAKVLRDFGIDTVMHFAAFIEVGESVADPGKYYENNFANALALLHALRIAGTRKFVFSSTAAVYGNPERTPIEEDHPLRPINPYGRSKMMVELALHDFAHAYGLGFAILRYFNVAGAAADGTLGEAHEPESHLIPRILSAAKGESASVSIFGTDYPTPDGTCIRDYVHVEDLVDAHLLAMRAIEPGRGSVYNVGSQSGFSVREVIEACRAVTKRPIEAVEMPRRAGDPAVLVASSKKIRHELGWNPKYPDLNTIVSHAWNWHTSGPHFQDRH